MAEYRLTGKAEQDLVDIIQYTRTHWGRAQADSYITGIEAVCQALADNPAMGKGCDDIAPWLLRHPVDSHVIYYLYQSDGVSILRVLHQCMLPSNHL